MANDYFQFKQFTIRQEKCAMKVGTDGVLLGAWADVTQARRLLDIGTGTGLIAIMAAQRNPELIIDAIEIDPAAFEQARENANNTPWRERIHIFQGKVQTFAPAYKYDTIVCNPPFFINSTKNRHSIAPWPGIAKHYRTRIFSRSATIYYYRKANSVLYYLLTKPNNSWNLPKTKNGFLTN